MITYCYCLEDCKPGLLVLNKNCSEPLWSRIIVFFKSYLLLRPRRPRLRLLLLLFSRRDLLLDRELLFLRIRDGSHEPGNDNILITNLTIKSNILESCLLVSSLFIKGGVSLPYLSLFVLSLFAFYK